MRWKLIAGNVLALLFVGVVGWLVVRGQVADALSQDAGPTVQRSVGLFDAVRTAEGEHFKGLVDEGAQRNDARAIFDPGTVSEQAVAAFNFVQIYTREIGTQYPARAPRPADIVAVTTADGHVLARNVDPNQDRNRDLRAEYELVEYALADGGRVARDFLKYDQQKWYDVAVAPIKTNGTLRGLLLVAYEIGDSIAREDSGRLGVDVGYLTQENNQFTAHSLSFGDQATKDALVRFANSPDANLAAVFNGNAASPVREINIGGSEYMVSGKAMPGVIAHRRAGQVRPGFLVLENVSERRSAATGTTMPILYLALLGLVIVALYNILMANYLLQPIEQIEEGLLRIINGDRDHRIEVQHAELGGIVYRINQLVSELTGAEDEADESGRISRPPVRASAPAASSAGAAAAGPVIDDSAIATFNPIANPAEGQLAQQLAAEPEASYLDRLHREYSTARTRAGLGPDAMSREQFLESVRASEQALAQKHGIAAVRFVVESRGQQVIFRAVPLR